MLIMSDVTDHCISSAAGRGRIAGAGLLTLQQVEPVISAVTHKKGKLTESSGVILIAVMTVEPAVQRFPCEIA